MRIDDTFASSSMVFVFVDALVSSTQKEYIFPIKTAFIGRKYPKHTLIDFESKSIDPEECLFVPLHRLGQPLTYLLLKVTLDRTDNPVTTF